MARFRAGFSAGHMRLVRMPDGRFAGCVSIRPRQDSLWLEHFYLFPEYQGIGLGSEILNPLLSEADRKGHTVRLEVLKQSRAQRFYAKHGFVPTGAGEGDVYMERVANTACQ